MKSRARTRIAKRSRWRNNPHSLRRRLAEADARREAVSAMLPPAYSGPEPGSHWQRIVIDVYVPTTQARCDQHATVIDGEMVGLLSATDAGREVSRRLRKRPSAAEIAEVRRVEYAAAAVMSKIA